MTDLSENGKGEIVIPWEVILMKISGVHEFLVAI